VFLAINLLEIPNYPISFNIFIQLFIIHMILYMIISYFRDQERALSRRLQRLNESLQEEVTLDILTGAYNRRAFNNIIERAISSHVIAELPCVLAIIDIDHFKRINDNYGHLKGDMVLKALGKHIKSKIREGDTLIRYGGEEFVICFENMELDNAMEIMEKIRTTVEKLSLVKGETITISSGLSRLQKGDSPSKLLSRADVALYEAKDAGRNKIKYI
jgi:diguanylate cyclase (GGDEF)-like protein